MWRPGIMTEALSPTRSESTTFMARLLVRPLARLLAMALLQVLLLVTLLSSVPAHAHEVRPAYLEITFNNKQAGNLQHSQHQGIQQYYDVLWKVPVRGPARLKLSVLTPANCSESIPVSSRIIDAARIDRWQLACEQGLGGETVFIDGLQNTITDVLLRVQHEGGSTETVRLTPTRPGYTLQGEQGIAEVALTYFVLGVEHILIGIDHLLFVLVLLLLVNNWRKLIITVTAFTLAHSITLALSALQLFSLPQSPVEAVIALSIVFVAAEVVHHRQGRYSMTASMPWIAAFAFGLLHGFGFAGALQEIGLPQHAIPLALAAFNFGVEAGQLIFIFACFILARVSGRMVSGRMLAAGADRPATFVTQRVAVPTAYLTGALACFWTIERTATFWS